MNDDLDTLNPTPENTPTSIQFDGTKLVDNYGGMDTAFVSGKEANNLNTLAEAKRKKLDRLNKKNQYSNLDDSFTELEDGTLESNRNKIWNELEDQEFQSLYTEALTTKALRKDENGNWRFPDGGIYEGEVRRLYGFGTTTDSDERIKIGLARGDLSGAEERYISNADESYGWAPGALGVDTNKKNFDVILPYDVATTVEAVGHGRKKALEGRVIRDIYDNALETRDFGSGVTEYYNSVEDFFGEPTEYSKELGRELLDKYLGVYNESARSSVENQESSDDFYTRYLKRKQERQGVVEGTLQTISGLPAGAIKGALDLADVGLEIATYIPQAIVRGVTGNSKYDIDLFNDEFKKTVIKYTDSLVGYDRDLDELVLQEAMEDFEKSGIDILDINSIKEAFRDPKKLKSLGDGIFNLITDTSLSISMISEIIGAGGGLKLLAKGGETLLTKASPKAAERVGKAFQSNLSKIKEEVLAAKAAGDTAKVAALEKSYTTLKAVPDIIKGNFYTNADMLVRMNNDITAFKENNNEENPDPAKLLSMAVLNRIASSAEVMSLRNIAGIKNITPDVVKEKTKEGIVRAAGSVMGKVATVTGTVAGNSLLEGTQELFDTVVEQLNQKVGAADFENKSVSEIISEASAEILTGFFAGAGAGGQISLGKSILDGAKELKNLKVNKSSNEEENTENDLPESEIVRNKRIAELEASEIVSEYLEYVDDEDLKTNSKGTAAAKSKFIKSLFNEYKDKIDPLKLLNIEETTEDATLSSYIKSSEKYYDNMLSELEKAEAIIEERKNTENELDELVPRVFKRVKSEIIKNKNEDSSKGKKEEKEENSEKEVKSNEEILSDTISKLREDEQELKEILSGSLDSFVETTNEKEGNNIVNIVTDDAENTNTSESTNDIKFRDISNESTNDIKFRDISNESTNDIKFRDISNESTNESSNKKSTSPKTTKKKSFSEMLNQIERAEVILKEQKLREKDNTEVDTNIKILQRAKFNLSKKIIESKKIKETKEKTDLPEAKEEKKDELVLGSGVSPQDVVETYIEAKRELEGDSVTFEEEEKQKLNDFLKVNKAAPFRFESMLKGRAGKKRAKDVYDESMGEGKISATSYRSRLRNLLNTPGVNKKIVEKEVSKIRNFLNSQEQRLAVMESAVKTVQDDIDNYNNSKGAVKTAVKPKAVIPVEDTKYFILTQENEKTGKYEIASGTFNIIESLKDTSGHLRNTLKRYESTITATIGNSDFSSEGIVVPSGTTGNSGIEESRKRHKNIYDKYKPNKVIVGKNSAKQWKNKEGEKGSYAVLNESKIVKRNEEFNENDVVLLTTPDIEASSTESIVFSKAILSGATIIIDPSINIDASTDNTNVSTNNKKDSKSKKGITVEKESLENLAKKYQGVLLKDETGKYVIVNKEKAEEITIVVNKNKKKKNIKEARLESLVDQFDKMLTIWKKGDTPTKQQQGAFNAVVNKASQYFPTKENDRKPIEKMRSHVVNVLKKEAAELEKTAMNIALTEGVESQAYSEVIEKARESVAERVNKRIETKLKRLNEGGVLVKKWKEAEAKDKKGEVKLSAWIKENFDDTKNAVTKALLQNSIGRSRQEKEKAEYYSYYLPKDKKYVVTTKLEEAKDPTKNESGFYQKIEIDPSTYVVIGETTLLSTLNIDEISIEGEGLFNEFVQEALPSVEKVVKKPSFGKNTALPFDLIDSPAASLIFDSELNINPNVAVAMRVALYNFIRNNGYMLGDNYISAKDLANQLGKEEYEVSGEALDYMQGKGMLMKNAGDSIGKEIIKLVGLKRKKDANEVDNQLFDALVAELGQIALLTGMEGSNSLLKLTADSSETYARKVLGKQNVIGSETVVNFVKINNKDFVEEKITPLVKILEDNLPSMNTYRKEPLFRAPTKEDKEKATKKIRNSFLNINLAKRSKEASELLMDTEYIAEMPLIRIAIEYKEAIKKLLGHIPLESDEYKNLSFNDQKTQAAKNRDIEQELENLEWLSKQEEGKEEVSLWFNYFFSKSGRFFKDSNTINPGTNKHLDRFFIQPKGHKNTYSYTKKGNIFKSEGKDVSFLVYYAIAQAFGFKVDKKENKGIEAFSKEVLKKLSTVKKVQKARKTFLNEKKYKINENTEIELEHLGNALQAFDFIEKAVSTPNKFTSSLSAEFDALTSGFGLKLLQMPIIKNVYTWLSKVGIIPESSELLNRLSEDSDVSMNNILDLKKENGYDKFLDSYQTLASKVEKLSYTFIKNNTSSKLLSDQAYPEALWEAVKEVLPAKTEKNEISSELRSLFKSPFMTFNYASSIKSIKRRLVDSIIEDIAKEIAALKFDGDEKEQKLIKVLEAFGGKKATPKELQKEVRKKPMTMVGTSKNLTGLGKYLQVMVEASYGVQVENILNEEFGEFVEAQNIINGSFKAIFEVFVIELEEAINDARKEGPISYEKEKEIYDGLIKKWPAIKGPLTDVNEETGEFSSEGAIGIYSLETAVPFENRTGRKPVKTKLSEGMGKKLSIEGKERKSISILHKVKALSAAIAAGSVIPIHYIDGAAMANTIIDMKGGITTIHDAIIPNLLNSGEVLKTYNKAVVDVNGSYSFINEIATRFKEIADTTTLNGQGKKTAYQTTKITVNRKEISVAEYFDEMYGSIITLANNVNNKRKFIFDELNKGSYIMHMVGTKDGVYEITEDNKITDKYAGKKHKKSNNINSLHENGKNLC